MELTLTAKVKLNPSPEQETLLHETRSAYQRGCQYVSNMVFQNKILKQRKLHDLTYRHLRSVFSLKSQMAQSVVKTVIARYKSLQSNGHQWNLVCFKKGEYDLVWHRDYTLCGDVFSINTLHGRIKVSFERKGMERYFDGIWKFGTAKLIYKNKKWFLHIPVFKQVEDVDLGNIRQVVGVDFGVNFLCTAYDSQGKTTFFRGKAVKQKRSHYQRLRQELQKRGTTSARRSLKKIGQRENRWMTDINHSVSKALVEKYGPNTLFVIEDLTGVRHATERVRLKDRYVTVSWAFRQLREMLEYKAMRNGSKVIAVDPKFTSQTCPKCGHTERANRDKRKHLFCCRNCGYRSNDDRIGAMNLQRKGIEYISAVTGGAGLRL
ncbi:RNA-guided endonuclease InsQ/TnpB family protein [Saccharococcus caldoxylosilyticus]|uniref:Putative transposase n=1 Tax=Parageobacillus caldoxylosilyticus NBRC 107762 TaxID=1220594 RepID=A0A023DJW9_9BACL|nr:RNA-guided endonuclease TnpB family protein [Parageobacillus caldoxylosilyticus]OQO98624.1 transposase [Geobacillus sp. 44B]MBB3854313.1 IS605 OrfB family transposase [Parageobacillus caldoxylosilyticus]QNU36874.1 IS200/IS605 family element transposase accessory protein TnpB [Geobacillus sp. 44B]QXJ40098.1 Putative transposase DNA-binding domain protein [Parageobacillus caldoxylosilyticus]GAJ41533.1 putative transposase [Parageobacillus caldoxylosilyticus NBRC 107762]